MDKRSVYVALITRLREEFDATVGAQQDAADYATNEEARAESKYDTQGLEASYLAAGQAAHARELASALERLLGLETALTAPCHAAQQGALVKCQQERFADWFYLAPVGGGEVLQIDDNEVTVITLHSPIGEALKGKTAGAQFALPNGNSANLAEVL
ncbi:MAG: transcription elongation factor GreAB [Verrucomicrobiota bacterium]